MTDGSGYYTRYEYDSTNNVTRMATGVPTVTEALDRETHSVTDYAYSYRDFLLSVTDPMGYSESYTYNSRGTVTSFTDKKGTVTSYTYNGAPWLLSKTASGINDTTQSVSYTYDYLGSVASMVDENGTTVYTYDKLGNVLSETRGETVKEYGYDRNGNRTSASINSGSYTESFTYTYDGKNRLTSVKNSDSRAKYTYDKNDRLLKEEKDKLSNETTFAYTTYSYYDSGLMQTKKNYTKDTPSVTYLVDDYALTYYADGSIATVENNDAVTRYVYDNAGRMVQETLDGVRQASYTYDAFGNRATMVNSTSTTTYTYDKNNRLTAENTQSDSGSSFNYYCYDYNGNLNEKYWGAGLATYTYDLFDRMTRYSSEGTGATYTYDGNGIRLSKTVNGVTTSFVNDGAVVVGEISGESVVKYTYGIGLVSISNNGVLGFYHTDEHGSVSAICDTHWSVVADYDYDAFGNEIVSTDGYYNPMKYCGEYFDSESGLVYLRARYYDPGIGRFTSEDPIKDGFNWYVYCNNNPVMFVDPWGLEYGDKFDTPDEAAIDFAECYNQKSIELDLEFGAVIYKVTVYETITVERYIDLYFIKIPLGSKEVKTDKVIETYYTYTKPRHGSSSGVDFSNAPKGTEPIAQIHTHGAYTRNEQNGFSYEDIESLGDRNRRNSTTEDTYVVTAWGDMFKATYENQYADKDKIYINNGFYQDPNLPDNYKE